MLGLLRREPYRCPRCGRIAAPADLWFHGGECSGCAWRRARYAGGSPPAAVPVTHPGTGRVVLSYPDRSPRASGPLPRPSSEPILESRPVRASALSPLGTSPGEPASARAPLEITVPTRPQIEFLPRREVDEWLFALVKGKTVLVTEIQREAAARGYSWSRVKRAMQRLGIDSEKVDWDKGWAWSLLLPF
jgi:hypothetical protein